MRRFYGFWWRCREKPRRAAKSRNPASGRRRVRERKWRSMAGADTLRRALVNITSDVNTCLAESGVREGLALINAMHITASRGAVPSSGEVGSSDGGDQGSEGDQAEPLMHPEHARTPVEPCLILGVSLNLILREPKIPQRRRRRIIGSGC